MSRFAPNRGAEQSANAAVTTRIFNLFITLSQTNMSGASGGPRTALVLRRVGIADATPVSLLLQHEVRAPVLLPALFVRFRAEWLLFAVADGAYPARVHAVLHQRALGRVGAL